ncbi:MULTISPECIES: copper homeostasis periplasmic binding protein CopC [Sphingomonadaceae]|uniref:CopC domain-containing protein n=1 Tax=Sphingobium subterraneum TaxID=627688 RepID=A0A841J465_9SPHN|nr:MULTISPECIES: copper homeostasis periplasmic binding protein CopC [Sphingomonadaceae]MBB6125594.1 hypothetical protein [Sphingobium subterraneum]CAH0498978.1 Copper resistance protein C [Novosphingobium sp. CECT 9465]
MFRKALYVLALTSAAFSATAAMAHPRLIGATPAANATVAAPTRIQLTFSENLVGQFSGIDLTMTEMPGMKMGPMKINGVAATVAPDGKTLVVALARPLARGTYKLNYHVVSADTHRIQGTYTFKVN